MLNYNLNINSPLQQEKKNEDVRPPIYWDLQMITSASDSSDLNEQSYGAMTITATNSNCIQVTADANGDFTTDAQFPVTASLTGSNWPVTGSMSMSLNTAGITYDPASTDQFYSASFRASALDIYNNPNITGSKIENNFSASEFYRFYVNGIFTHTKGNVYNGPINWLARNQSPSTTTGNVNGYTASFNIVKDRNVSLFNLQEVTGSTSSSFNNFYALNITSSLTASIINDATGSTTMSINIPEAGIITSSLYFNPTSAGVKIVSASFTASNNNAYNITASVIFNKGNISTASINYQTYQDSTTQDLEGNSTNLNGISSSFELRKDATIQKVYIAEVTGSVQSGFYNNDYAFNQTASLTQNVNNTTGSVTMSIVVAEAGINTQQRFFNPTTSQALLTASFAAQTILGYNITASVINNKGNESNSNINYKVSSSSTTQDLEGNTTQLNNNSSSFNLKKDIAVLVNYNNITASISGTYKNNYSFNQTASLTSSILPNTTGSVTMSLVIPEIGFSTSSLFFNPTSAGIKILSASFVAQTASSSYNITASVINNKGNESNSNINYFVTGSGNYLNSASLNIRKDANTTMVSESFVTSTSGTYKNNYAFNQTASLSSSFVPLYNSNSSSYFIQKLDMKIPEINFSQSMWISSSCGAPLFNLITASFEAQTNVPNYNITASIQEYQQSVVKFNITASGAGGGGGAGSGAGGGGGGAVVSASAAIQPNLLYQINIGAPGAAGSGAGGTTTFIGCDRTINIYAGGGAGGGGTAGPGGDSGTGTIIENGVTSSAYPAFTGGAGASAGSGFGDRYAGGGGASNTANGANGVITGAGAANGGDGASGNSFGGGGGYQGAGPTPPPPGSDGGAGTGTLPNGAGGGGNGASTGGGGSGRQASAGNIGIVLIKHADSGSLFTTTNASSSYSSDNNETTYFFTSGSGTLFYQPIPTLG